MPNTPVVAVLAAGLRCARMGAALALAEQRRDLVEVSRLAGMLDEAIGNRLVVELQAPDQMNLPLNRLATRLGLSGLDTSVLMVAAALELDPLFASIAAALAGEEPRQGLSPRMFAHILRLDGDTALKLRLDAHHPLVRTALLESSAPAGLPDSLRPYRLNPRVTAFLADDQTLDPLLGRVGAVVPIPDRLDLEHAQAARALCEQALRSGEDVVLCIEGAEGAGRRTMVAAVASELGREVVALDASRLPHDRGRSETVLRALRRECWLREAVPVVARLDAVPQRDARRSELYAEIADALESEGAVHGPAVITCVPGTELPELRRRVVLIRVDAPTSDVRTRMWSEALGAAYDTAAPAFKDNLPEVVQPFSLMPGGIIRAAANVRMIARGRPLEPNDVRAGVSAEIRDRFQGLAARVITSQRWEDLVLPEDTLDEVNAFTARAAHMATVYDRWGFRAKLQRGLGLAALFSGPPGTGKTMVAGLIAQSLGLDLYAVDLSQVVSKWIGETEKHLGKIFDAASMGNVALLFDEADALFAKRTDVKSSNDRYANLEVNYLLQRLEQFGGIAMLTTNAETAVDPAFKRRLAADVRFAAPEEPERERLWRTGLPKQAPTADDLDFGRLAADYDMCGGNIRNAVLRAAFLAAAEGSIITQSLLHRAAKAEYRAMGKISTG